MAGRAVKGAISAFPGAEAAVNLMKGQPAYPADAEGAGRVAGDIGGAAAAVASGGLAPLAKFSGLAGALNALGIPQGAYAIGTGIENLSNKVMASDLPSKIAGIEGLGTGLNMMSRTPGALADIVAEAAPYALAGHAIAGGEKAPVPAEAKAPAPPTAADLIAQHGGELTPAMRATGPIAKAVTGWIEKLAGSNPLTQALPEGIRAKNIEAVNKYLETNLGQPVAGLSSLDYAPVLQDALNQYKASRGAKFSAAEAGLQGIASKLPKPVGQMASDRIISMLKEAGVPSDENGFNPALLTGNEKIDPNTANALIGLERQVRNAKTIPDLLAQRQNIDRSGIPNFQAPPDQMGRLKNMARGVVNDTLTQAVDSSGDANAIAKWKAANSEYSATAPVMNKAGKVQSNKLNGPEALTKMLTNPAQGGQALAQLKANMAPEQWEAVQNGAINAILDRSRKNGVISADSLKTNLGKTMAPIVSQLDPVKQQVLRTAQEMMDKAQLSDLGRENPSGSGHRAASLAHMAALLNPSTTGPMLGESGALGAYYGAGKVIPPTIDAISALKSRVANLSRSAIPGTPAIPGASNIPAMVLAAMGAQRNAAQQAGR